METIPRRASLSELEPIVAELASLHEEVDNMLESYVNFKNPSGNESQIERQHSNSNTDSIYEFEPAFEKSGAAGAEPRQTNTEPLKSYPLGLVLKACPDIAEYAVNGIDNWRDLMATTVQVRGYLGISPSAYEDALDVLGQENTAIVIACILQRANHINSAGGYLRVLMEKARAGAFSVGPMLMAALRTNADTQTRSNEARTG